MISQKNKLDVQIRSSTCFRQQEIPFGVIKHGNGKSPLPEHLNGKKLGS